MNWALGVARTCASQNPVESLSRHRSSVVNVVAQLTAHESETPRRAQLPSDLTPKSLDMSLAKQITCYS